MPSQVVREPFPVNLNMGWRLEGLSFPAVMIRAFDPALNGKSRVRDGVSAQPLSDHQRRQLFSDAMAGLALPRWYDDIGLQHPLPARVILLFAARFRTVVSPIDRRRFFRFSGRMRWKMTSYLACFLVGLTCPLLHGEQLAPGTVKYELWLKDKTIMSGIY
jgi:hypothetical protein